MRVLRLDLPDGPVELHPFVTVVRGLPPTAREALLAALSSVPRGTATASGLVEAHGVLLDLDADTLDMLDLHSDVDAVVRTGDLPGISGAARLAEAERRLAEAEAAVAAAEAIAASVGVALDAAREALAAARAGAAAGEPVDVLAGPRADLEAREHARAVAARALQEAAAAEQFAARNVLEADAVADAARTARTGAARVVAEAAAALEAAGEQRDPVAGAALEAARARLDDAEAALVVTRSGEDGGEAIVVAPPTEEDVVALRAERLEVEAAVLALETGDPSPVRLALEQILAGAAMEPVPDPRALDLADRWGELEAELQQAGADGFSDEPGGSDELPSGDAHATARLRLVAAESALATAEASLRVPTPDQAELRALEAAHAEVLEAREAQERRFRRGGADKRLADAEEAERALLQRLGFATFTDYLMGARDRGGETVIGLDAARSELFAASAAADEIDAAVSVELQRAELLDRRRELRAAACELLGSDPGDDLVGALRRRRVPATETGGYLDRLRSALEVAGLVFDDEILPERTLVDLATVWLEEQERAAMQRASLEERIADLESRLAEANRLRSATSGAVPAPTALAAGLAAVDQARAAVVAAEARLERHREAEAAVEDRRHAFEAAAAEELRLVAAVAEAEALCVDARAAERDVAARVLSADAEVTAAVAARDVAAELLAGLEDRVADAGVDAVDSLEADVARLSAQLVEVEADVARATEAVEVERRVVAECQAEEHRGPVAGTDTEDAEWFLLARLAGQRAVSFAGSVPLVLDDALAGFDAEPTLRLLHRLERMASTVQLVVVTEDLTTAAWAEALGRERAVVVQV